MPLDVQPDIASYTWSSHIIEERLQAGSQVCYITICALLRRDSTRYVDGKHMRDLGALNRELSNVLLITASDDINTLQPENVIQVLAHRLWQYSMQLPGSCDLCLAALSSACLLPLLSLICSLQT